MKEHQASNNLDRGQVAADQAAEIVRLYQHEQLKMVAVARRLGLTEWRVWKTLHRLGAPLRPKGRRKGSWDVRPLVWLDRACRLYEGGHSLVAVAEAVGISPRKLRYHFQRAGVPCRKPGRPRGAIVQPPKAAASQSLPRKDKRKKQNLGSARRSPSP
jgi:hypothetical protein